jgi:hypothetical protein
MKRLADAVVIALVVFVSSLTVGCSGVTAHHQHIVPDTAMGPGGFEATAGAIVSDQEFQAWAQHQIDEKMRLAVEAALHPKPVVVSDVDLLRGDIAKLVEQLDAFKMDAKTALESVQAQLDAIRKVGVPGTSVAAQAYAVKGSAVTVAPVTTVKPAKP